jgi:hypothetical protein
LLTDGRDNFTGTENDDTFIGMVGQNQNGAVSNAFATGDVINGGAGRDKIEASMINDNETDAGQTQAPRPVTRNVEEVFIEALENVTLDATRMEGVEEFWSDFSRGDMTFSGVNLRGSNVNITKDITFGMKDVDRDSSLTARFESQALVREAASASNSQLLVRIADVSTETPETPLANVNLNLSFDLGDVTISLENVQSTDGTYAGLVAAINNQLALEGYANLNVNLSNAYNEVTVAGNTVVLPFTAQEILITDPAGNSFNSVNFTQSAIQPVADGFLVAGNAQPVDPSQASNLIESNLVLDNAGRGSQAGDVFIGGMSDSNVFVEKLNLIVDRDSSIRDLMTGNQNTTRAFQQIEVTSGEAQGNLAIADVGNVYNFDATAFEGESLSVSGQAGLTAVNADWAPNAENVAHVYNTGSSNDTITVNYAGDKAAEFAGFSLSINSGAGNDTIHTISEFAPLNNLADQQELLNVIINSGAGNDTVRTEGSGAVLISTGAGNDTIYTDNSGTQWMDRDAGAATWLVNAVNQDINDLRGENFGITSGETVTVNGVATAIPAVLFGAELTIAFSGANAGGGVTATDANSVAGFSNGFESTVSVLTNSNQVFGDQRDINDAIKRAISEDAVLSKLLVVEDGPNHSLVIRSLIDGSFVADDLEITLSAADASTFTTAQTNNITSAIQEALSFSGFTGTNPQPTIQDILNGSVAAGNNLSGLGVDAAVIAQTTGVQFTVAPGTLDASTGGTLTFLIDGTTVVLTEGVDFNQSGANLASTDLANVTITANGVQYTLADDGGDLTVTGATGNSLVLTDGTATVQDLAPAPVTVDLTGTQSVANNNGTVINAGTGDDVIVLSSSTDSKETIVFEGSFGNDTIVNFDDTNANALDQLDFTAYLINEVRTSASSTGVSELRIATSLDGAASDTTPAGDLGANEIGVLSFTFDVNQNNGANTFEAMTGAQLLAALNGDSAYGNLNDDLDSDNAATNFGNAAGNLVGDTQYHIVLVENAANEGEYKVFQLTSVSDAGANVDAGDFATATLLGSVDFGNQRDRGQSKN